jgi:hypothetical protein
MLFLFNDGVCTEHDAAASCRVRDARSGVLVAKNLPPMGGGLEVWKFKEWLPLRMLNPASPPVLFNRSDGKRTFALDVMVFYGGGDDVVAFLQALALALADMPSECGGVLSPPSPARYRSSSSSSGYPSHAEGTAGEATASDRHPHDDAASPRFFSNRFRFIFELIPFSHSQLSAS